MKKIFILPAVIVFLQFLANVPADAVDATWVHFSSNGTLVYNSDDLGNHLIDYSYAGYEGGGVALPANQAVKTNLTALSGDNKTAIQNAINYVGGLPADANGIRGVVLLAPGKYNISGGLSLNKSGVILRGSGNTTNGTVIHVTSTATGGNAITIAGSSGAKQVSGSTQANITDTYVPLGATSFHVDSTSGLAVGTGIVVRRPWTSSWINAIGMSGIWGSGQNDAERTITAINGTQITVDMPLPTPIEQKWCTGIVYPYTDSGRVEQTGVENLRLVSDWGLATTGTTNGFGWTGTHFGSAKNCWARDIAFDGFGIGANAATSPQTKFCTVQDCTFDHGIDNGSARPPAFEIDGQMCLFQRLTGINGFHHLCQTSDEATGPNVYLYCNATGSTFDGGPHRAWAVSLLTDNEFGTVHNVHITIVTGGNDGWGAGYSTFYNCHTSNHTIECPQVDHHYNWWIGGSGTQNATTMPGIFDHDGTTVTPTSLYLEQLKERLGGQAVENIGYQMFTISATPASQSVASGSTATFTVNVGDPMLMSNVVALSVSGLPAGATAQFSPSSVQGTDSSTLTVSLANVAAGSYNLTINGTSAGLTHSAPVILTVSDFSVSATPPSQTINAGDSASYTVNIGSVNGFNGTVSLNASGLPSGATASFSAGSVTVPGSSTLTIATSTSTPAGTYTITIHGTSGSTVRTATITLTVNAILPPDFTLSASPGSVTITQGNSGTSTVSVNDLNSYNSAVSLSASGLPSGVTASFNPTSTATSSVLTLTAGSTATTGGAIITISGTDGTLTHTTTISLTVNPSGGTLPAGWTDADLGAVGVAGSASDNNGTFTLNGSGTDIFGTGDQFNYAYQSLSGDQTVIARVVSETQTAGFAKAGVMIRESLATNAVEACAVITPTNGIAMEVRPTTGAATINMTGWIKGPQPPQWVKLVRSGSTFTASYSADGSTWTQIASTNLTMASAAEVGLAVTAHNNSALNTATFDNVSITAGNVIDTSKIYKLQNVASGLVLNNQGSLTNGSKITQWTATTVSTNLDWVLIPTSNGYYQINSLKSGKDAVVQGASTGACTGIVQWDFGTSGDDQWKPVANGDGSYTFFNLNSGLVLADPGSSTSTSTQMDQETSNGGANQKWKLLAQ